MQEMQKNKVNVEIDGKEYTIIGIEDPEYILAIAKKVNDTIAMASGDTLGFSMKLVLAALNLADETEKVKAQLSEYCTLLTAAQEKNDILQKNLNALRERNMDTNIVKLHKAAEEENEKA
ncbi:MAG: cell division protein ZapA [Clostridia bacterium]|nr:cell division protein ZapA [Clostridia bacterium]